MTPRIEELRAFILDRKHHRYRRSPEELGIQNLCEEYSRQGWSAMKRAAVHFSTLLEMEEPLILPGEKIVFTTTITSIPQLFTPKEWENIKKSYYLHERGYVCNISPDYEYTLTHGLEARKDEIRKRLEEKNIAPDSREFLEAAFQCVESLQNIIDRYEQFARVSGENDIADTLNVVKTEGATTFREALQLLRILHFSLWRSNNYHNTLGRIDQYLYPFYKKDIRERRLTDESALELLEDFFLNCNKDSDLYPGMQQGDNGQSVVLGGRNREGEILFNALSELCLKASYELALIDPKINIRVDKNTPLEIFEKGSQLTKIGLGFPQYSNDDVVIPGLIEKGYSKADARNYVVAACWEFIIPGAGMDIPNIDAVSLIDCVSSCMKKLPLCTLFEDFYRFVEEEIQSRVDAICEKHRNLYMIPAPMISLLMDETIEKGRDISLGGKYNNYGIHGTGIASAVDSLVAIKKYCFEEKRITAALFCDALKNNFNGYPEIRKLLRYETPKMGQDDDYADNIAVDLLNSFAQSVQGKINERGGIYRAGTGTAMYYVSHSQNLGATPEGRDAGESIPANYSPTLFISHNGPLSVIKSFTKPALHKVINGGPLTLEFDQCIFNNRESLTKLANLVRIFIKLGGHQLQLNTLSKERLLEAKRHPEKHRNLIVRVWGWSGYFVELDECYQEHILQRIEFQFEK